MFYLEQKNNIVIADSNKERLQTTLEVMPQYEGFEIRESDVDIVQYNDKWYFINDEEYIRQKEQEEKERIAALSMTRSDFFDGMIMAFGLDSKELRVVIENILNSINITPVEIKVALNNYDNALNFYRKHTLFTLLSNVPIDIGEYTLIFTSDIWNKFFDTKDYRELQKAIQVEPEPTEENSAADSEVANE